MKAFVFGLVILASGLAHGSQEALDVFNAMRSMGVKVQDKVSQDKSPYQEVELISLGCGKIDNIESYFCDGVDADPSREAQGLAPLEIAVQTDPKSQSKNDPSAIVYKTLVAQGANSMGKGVSGFSLISLRCTQTSEAGKSEADRTQCGFEDQYPADKYKDGHRVN